MRKAVSVLLAVALVLSLAACGGGGAQNQTTSQAPATTQQQQQEQEQTTAAPAAAGRQIKVGFAQIGSESDWRVGCTNSVKQACEDAGFDLTFVDANQQQHLQIQALRDFITQNVDYIGFSPVVETGWDQVMKEIKDAGIPVIMLDRNIEMPNRDDYYETWIGSNFIEEGEKSGKWLIEYLEQEGRVNDQINIVELQGTVGSSPAIDRKTGFENIIADYPNLVITQSQTGDFTTELGKEVMESFIRKAQADGTKIDVLYAHNDGMAIGAIQAIKEAGLAPGKDIVIIGVDAVKLAFEAIIADEMNVTVECSPLLGPQFVQAINDIEAGKNLEKITYSIEFVYDETLSKAFPDKYLSAVEHFPSRVY
ncbi:MAG: ABC transporter substrate-binding protein [Oscillospiraceae bacterium]|nr:ABC transporter substrate-binding protein [Oscillospiraceae bacterium]